MLENKRDEKRGKKKKKGINQGETIQEKIVAPRPLLQFLFSLLRWDREEQQHHLFSNDLSFSGETRLTS